MTHQQQLEKAGFRQWAKAVLGLGYLKEGLAPLCQEIAKQQQKEILDKIQRTKYLPPPLTCSACQLKTIKPDHTNVSRKVCRYGQVNCNCWFLKKSKIRCPNQICGAIYDAIIESHASSPPAPYWKNTDSQMWTADPWSIAKCFINAPGYDQTTSATETDCTGLLHVIINNQYYHSHITCNLTATSIFSKVLGYRNKIFHSSSMELKEPEANSYIDDMISILQDDKELLNNLEAQLAVKKLQALKTNDFIITTEEILREIKEEMGKVLKSTENLATKEEYEGLKTELSDRNGKSANEHAELKKQIIELETLMAKEKEEKLKAEKEREKEHLALKNKLTELEAQMLKELEAKKEYLKLKENFDKLFSEQKKEMDQIRKEGNSYQKQINYDQAKSEWQNNMIQQYHNTVLKVPAMPLLPDEVCKFSDIYVRPEIVSEVKNEKRETEEIEINSMSEIFTRNGVPQTFIYIVGDAGTGKSSFCNYLVNCWCMAHSEGQIEEDDFNGVNEMKKFDFLFLITLRHNQGIESIHNMLKNQYNIEILDTLLDRKSEKMIILLDGLDEWSSEGNTHNQFQTIGLPRRDIYKKYTIVTTSRPWKIHTLRIRDIEIHLLLKIKGFNDDSESKIFNRTLSQYNTSRNASKMANDEIEILENDSVASLKQIPIMFQQLICLWLDGKLNKTTRCAIYTEMLELFFTWNENKCIGKSVSSPKKVDLPCYLAIKRQCKSYSHLIYDMSRLAYETLFKCPKEKSLIFDACIFEQLEISDETQESCLKIALLTEDRCPSLSVSEPPSCMFSFIHKSVQEFLAAVNIAINFKNIRSSSNKSRYVELERECTQFVSEVFKDFSTVNGLLEQSDVVIMLFGLEPRLATHVSRFVCDIITGDPLVQRSRRTVDSDIYGDYRCIRDIQNVILDSMKECNVHFEVDSQCRFYIGDLYIAEWDDSCDIICASINHQQITPDSVLSIHVEYINTLNVKFAKLLPKFKNLEKVKIEYDRQMTSSTEYTDPMTDEVNNSVAETIKINASTIQSLSLGINHLSDYTDRLHSLCNKVVPVLYRMNNLLAIEMTHITMRHADTIRLCGFLKSASHLEQISIDIKCECRKKHVVDLSNHTQLQYLSFNGRLCVTFTDTVNLEIFNCWNIKRTNYLKVFDSIEKCSKLKKLELYIDGHDKSISYHTSITEILVLISPSLSNLSEFKLHGFRLTYKIIEVTSEMKSIKDFILWNVIVSLTTWRKFLDSLHSIPHSVDVKLSYCCITGDFEEFDDDLVSNEPLGGKKGNEAIQYIKHQEELFDIKRDDPYWFEFSTRKSVLKYP